RARAAHALGGGFAPHLRGDWHLEGALALGVLPELDEHVRARARRGVLDGDRRRARLHHCRRRGIVVVRRPSGLTTRLRCGGTGAIERENVAMDLLSRVASVTGTRRIGAVVAATLAQRGADVAVVYNRSKAEADEAAANIRAAGRRALVLQGDLAEPAACERV